GLHGVLCDLVRGYRAIQAFYRDDADANDITGMIGEIVNAGGTPTTTQHSCSLARCSSTGSASFGRSAGRRPSNAPDERGLRAATPGMRDAASLAVHAGAGGVRAGTRRAVPAGHPAADAPDPSAGRPRPRRDGICARPSGGRIPLL